MIKSELVTRLALQNPHMFQREVEGAVNAVVDEIAEALRNRNRVELRGFGAFSVRVRRARTGRNPRTGEPVEVNEKAAPFFRVGKEMRDRINAIAAASNGRKAHGNATSRRPAARDESDDDALKSAAE